MIVSSATMSATTRASIARLQSELTRAQDELSSGRKSQLGLTLGARSISTTILRGQIDESQAFLDANTIAAARFDAVQTTLGSLSSLASGMQEKLLGAASGASSPSAVAADAQAALSQAMALMNTSFDGASLFVGLGVGKALKDYSANGEPAVVSAFQARFGFAPGDPASASITASDMQDFLATTFASQFDSDASWSANWSNATNDAPETRISETVSVQNSVSANAKAVRNLLKSLTMVGALGLGSLSADAKATVIQQATDTLGAAQTMLTDTIAQVGVRQSRLQEASDELSLRHGQLTARLDGIEAADPAELSTRIASLSAQLQASYQVTSKLSQLSLINFI